MKKWIIAASVVLAMACASQASLINTSGTFVDGSISFTYDGKQFQDGWAIRVYQGVSGAVNFDILNIDNFLNYTTVSVHDDVLPFLDSVTIVGKGMSFTDNTFVYSVLFDTAVPTSSSGNYLLLDTVARDVGAHDPQVAYTPGHDIPYAGTVTFDSQTWQPIAPVPEPATMSLLGLGALAMVLRRKMRK